MGRVGSKPGFLRRECDTGLFKIVKDEARSKLCIYNVEKPGVDHSKSLFEKGGGKIVRSAVRDINTGYKFSQILRGYGFERIQQCGGAQLKVKVNLQE